MMIKAVFFDIDGTLVSFQTHRIPESAMRAIECLRLNNIKVFIATGRHWRVINNLQGMEFDGYVTLNGSCCYVGKDQLVYRRAIPRPDIERLVKLQEESLAFPCIFVRENGMFINYTNEQTTEIFQLLNFPEPPVQNIREALDSDVFQLVAFFNAEQEKFIMSELGGCEVARWNPLFTDVIPKGGSKRVGIEKILEYFDIDADECMAFGDGGNDIPMLRYVGKGVAMGNASAEVQQAADFVTLSVDDGGVEYALRHFGLLD